MRKIKFLLTLLIVLIGSIGFASAKTVYLKTNDAWTADGARFALYYFEQAQPTNVGWADFVALGSILKAEVPSGDYDKMIVCRMNGGTTENNWDNKWNQSADMNIPSNDNALYLCPNVCGDGAVFATSYIVGFDTSIATSNHDFKVAKGWGHIVGSGDYDGYGPYYMSYSYNQTSGVGGTGTLLANRQFAGDYGGGDVINDILVTPAVNGTVTLDIMASTGASNSNNAFVEVYAINVDGSLGDLLKTIKTEIPGYNTGSSTSWATYELANLASEQKIGLRCQYVYIDNFTAEEVNIPVERTLMVTKVANLEGYEGTGGSTTYFEQQPDGTLKVQLKVTLQNTGDYDLNPGDDNYTLTVASASYASGTKTYYDGASIAITEAIDAGETKDIDVDFYVPYASGWKYWFVKENVSGTTSSSYRYAGTTAYEPKFVFRGKDSSSSSNLSTTQTFGLVNEATTKSYEIANTGTAPLTINSIEITGGFTTDAAGTDVVLFRTSGYNADGAVWYAWTWNDGEEGTWVPEAEGKFTGLRQKVNFIRMNPAGAGNLDYPGWSYEWNRTGDLTVEPGKTYVIDSWGDTYEEKNYVNGHWAAAVVEKNSRKIVDITIPGTQGNYSGNLNIKYLDKDAAEKTYTLAFTGTVLPAGTWGTDFNGDNAVVYPAGSIAEAGINSDYQFADGAYNYFIVGRSYSTYATDNNKFITPKLHATAGQQLTFDVKGAYGSSYYAKVYVSTDRKTWGEPVAYYTYSEKAGAEAIGSSWVNKSITFDAEGDYYVAFSLYGTFAIDNIIGLTKVDVAHDLYIKSVNWPDASINSGVAQSKPSVDIIPLTDETAEAYTVKYVCGETVLAEGTPDALTASASSTKTFSFSWTPEVESTTVYENTKVVFDFGGGVTFETDPFTLTVVKEPKFHFVKTLPSNKWEPTDYTTPITFGKTNTADTQTFYVYNWGTAPLTVKSISVPEGFTVTPTEQFSVVAFDENNLSASSQAVTITFSTTIPGEYSGDMVITYVDGLGNDQTFVLAVSGTKLDPTKWYATFDDGNNNSVWPAGSVYNGLSLTNGGTYSVANYYAYGNGMFVTPKMTVAAGDKITFDAKLYSSSSYYADGSVTVYVASTRDEVMNAEEGTTRTQVFKVSGEDTENPITTDFQTFEVTFADAGEYYIGFDLYDNVKVDEFYGLTPVAVEHDWMIASSNIPADAMQNVASEASVNLLNLGLADEAADSYEVNLYINGEVAGTGTAVAIPMNHKLSDAGTQLTVPIYTLKTGTFPVYIEVKAGAYSIATEPVSVTFAEEEAISDVQVGTKSTTSSSVPFYTSWMDDSEGKSMSDFIYTPEQLAASGIKAGYIINSITFVGTPSGTKTINSLTTDAWVAQQAVADFTPGAPDKENMTHVVLHNGQSVEFASGTPYEFKINLSDNPIVYDGTSGIRIYTNINGNGQYQNINFDIDNNYQYAYYAHGSASFSSKAGNPVAFFALSAEPKTYSGTITDEDDKAIENATVSLVSTDGKNVQYSAITDKNGAYSINVVQSTREYNATVSAYGYDDATDNNITFADNVDKDFKLESKPTVSVTVTSAEWATITTPATYAVSFDENTEVYIATAEEGNSIKLTKIDDAPAMTPVVIHATAGAYTMTQKATATSNVEANILKSAKGNEVGDGNGNYYVLGMQNAGVGFGPLADGITLAKGKAYLIPTSPSGFLTFVIGDEDETTTINAVDAAGMDDDTPVYNLAGQKVGKDYKGVVIVNGKKVIRK